MNFDIDSPYFWYVFFAYFMALVLILGLLVESYTRFNKSKNKDKDKK